MSDLNNIIEGYMNSTFYQKYKDTYFSDSILKKVFKCEILLHKLHGQNRKSYAEIHRIDVDVMRDLLDGFVAEINFSDADLFWKMLNAFYIDPDPFECREFDGVICSADALLSIKRIFLSHGISNEIVNEFERYRKVPIFFFPQEKNGINMTRAAVFGDRIDYTLFDLKNYFEAKTEREREQSRLIRAYKLPKTKQWLDSLGSFEALADWYQIKGVFVNHNYEVYEIENGQNRVITGYLEKFSWSWSNEYYENLKRLSEQFMERRAG